MNERLEKIVEVAPRKDEGTRPQNPSQTYEGLKALGYQVFMGPTSVKYWM